MCKCIRNPKCKCITYKTQSKITSLIWWFVEDMPNLWVITALSLLGYVCTSLSLPPDRSSQAQASDWMGNVCELSCQVSQQGLNLDFGRATQIQSETRPEVTSMLLWLFTLGQCHAERWSILPGSDVVCSVSGFLEGLWPVPLLLQPSLQRTFEALLDSGSSSRMTECHLLAMAL